jgi:(p)ppGpp synthase/HD superfamily hydrolase
MKMNYNEKVNLEMEAQKLAYRIHEGKICFLSNEPKTYHLEAVVKKLKSLIMVSEDLIITGYLHDCLDYCDNLDKNWLKNNIKSTFGEHILNLIEEVSDNFKIEDICTPEGKNAFEKKLIIIKTPSNFSDDAATITLVEKVTNLEAIYREVEKKGTINYWIDFKEHYNLDKSAINNYYEKIYDALSDRCEINYRLTKLIDQFDYLIDKIFF